MPLDVAWIAPKLWIGSAPLHREQRVAVGQRGFRTLVLCAEEYQPAREAFPGAEVLHAPFDDAPFEEQDQGALGRALAAGEAVASRIAAGRRCLVTCMAGRNRSGLVCAMALAEAARIEPWKAAQTVKDARLGALSQPAFVDLLNRMRLPGSAKGTCELCQAERVTPWLHEDPICWVAICKSCHLPMVVFRQHGTQPSHHQQRRMLELLLLCCPPRRGGWRVDLERRTIPDHWHAHARPRVR